MKGTPKPEVSWFKNEVKLEPTDRITIDTKEVGIILEIISCGNIVAYTKWRSVTNNPLPKISVGSWRCSHCPGDGVSYPRGYR